MGMVREAYGKGSHVLGGPLEKSLAKAPFEMLHGKLPETRSAVRRKFRDLQRGVSGGLFSHVLPPGKIWKNSAKDLKLQVE